MKTLARSCATLLPATLALLGAAAITAASPAAHAASPSARRLVIEIDFQRDAGVQLGAESGRGKLVQQVRFAAVLASDGVPTMHNPLDPADGARQAERAQRTQHKVQAALDRQRGSASPAPDPAAMQAKALQMQAKCGSDRECLMREATAMASVQVAGGNPALQARLQSYGNAATACERQHKAAAARDACIAQARRQHGGSDDSDADEAVETPYLHFAGRAGCQVDIANRIDERVQGSFADVQGQVGFTQTTQAELRHRDGALCPLLQAVLDTRTGRLWTAVTLSPTEPQGVTTRSEAGRKTERTTGGVPLQWHEAGDWLQGRLSRLSSAGEDQTRLPAGRAGRPDGQTEVKLRWRFEPV